MKQYCDICGYELEKDDRRSDTDRGTKGRIMNYCPVCEIFFEVL